jgi:hypothetical protein
LEFLEHFSFGRARGGMEPTVFIQVAACCLSLCVKLPTMQKFSQKRKEAINSKSEKNVLNP